MGGHSLVNQSLMKQSQFPEPSSGSTARAWTESLGHPLNLDSGDWALAIMKRLAWAASSADLQESGNHLSRHLACSHLAIYCLHTRRNGQARYRQVVDARSDAEKADADALRLPQNITQGSALFDDIARASGRTLGRFDARHQLPSDAGYLPLSRNGKRMGLVVFRSDSPAVAAKHRARLRQLGIQCVLAAQRIHQQTSLERRGKSLDQIFTYTREAFCQWSKEEGWQYHNRHLLHRIGYSAKQWPLQNVFGHPELVSKGEWSRLSAVLDSCISDGRNTECEHRVRAPDGDTRTFWTRLRVLKKDRDGRASAIAGISVDISDSKNVEAEADARAELEGWLLEQNSQLFNRCDRSAIADTLAALGRRLKLSRCFIRVYQGQASPVYAEWQQPGVTPISSVNPGPLMRKPKAGHAFIISNVEKQPAFREALELSRRANTRAQMIMPMSHEEMLHGYLICQNTDARDWTPLERRAASILADTLCMVMVKESIHQKLLASQEQFQLALQASSYGLWEFNISDQTIYLSPSYYAMLGFREAIAGFHEFRVSNVHFDDRKIVMDYARALTQGSITEFACEARYISEQGNILWILMRGRIIKWDDTGKPLRAMGTMSDITAIKNAQMDLQLARKEAEAAHLAKSEFLARMSHEIRTPMNAIIGMAYLILQSPLDEYQRACIVDIDNAAKALLRIIDDILDFSKIEAGKLILERHDFNFHRCVHGIVAQFRAQARRRGLSFEFTLDPATPRFIQSDSTRLRQVLSSLLDNALKFTTKGGVQLSIEVEPSQKNDLCLAFTVEDTGIGLSAFQVDSLFDPFTQADSSSTRQYGGTGLGLAIAKQLVTMMGGDIMVTSRPGEGSAFRFTLHCQAPMEGITSSDEGVEEDRYAILRDKRVLLAEDNKVNQKVALGFLHRVGMQVTVANDGSEALRIMEECDAGHFDLILMDIEMPLLDGFEASKAIRKIPRHNDTAIIAMTAHDIHEHRASYLEAGMNDCFSKPIKPDALYSILANNLAKNEGRSTGP